MGRMRRCGARHGSAFTALRRDKGRESFQSHLGSNYLALNMAMLLFDPASCGLRGLNPEPKEAVRNQERAVVAVNEVPSHITPIALRTLRNTTDPAGG